MYHRRTKTMLSFIFGFAIGVALTLTGVVTLPKLLVLKNWLAAKFAKKPVAPVITATVPAPSSTPTKL